MVKFTPISVSMQSGTGNGKWNTLGFQTTWLFQKKSMSRLAPNTTVTVGNSEIAAEADPFAIVIPIPTSHNACAVIFEKLSRVNIHSGMYSVDRGAVLSESGDSDPDRS